MNLENKLFVHIGCPVMKDWELGRLKDNGLKVLIIDDIGLKPAGNPYFSYWFDTNKSVVEMKNKIATFCKEKNLELVYIFTLAEGSVDFTNQMLLAFALPPIYGENIDQIRDKFKMRKLLERNGIRIPYVALAPSIDAIPTPPSDKFPLIVKPVDSMESRSVSKVTNQHELNQACLRVFSEKTFINADQNKVSVEEVYGLKCEALIETCFEGQEHSVEVVVVDGKIVDKAVIRRVSSGYPHYFELGDTAGLDFLTQEQSDKLDTLVKTLIRACKYQNTILHIEFICSENGELNLVECNSRLVGAQVSCLIEMATGVNYLLVFLTEAAHLSNFKWHKNEPTNIWTKFLIFSAQRQHI